MLPKASYRNPLENLEDQAFEQRNVGYWFASLSITMNIDGEEPNPDQNYQNIKFHKWYTNAAPPAILHVSKESRGEGLKYYSLEP